MKNKALRVILIIAAAVWAVWSIVSGAAGLAKSGVSPLSASSQKGSLCEFKAVYAKEIYNIDHKLMVILPLGTERFYFVIGENDEPAPILVKASRAWFDSNFNENGFAKRVVTVKGEVREFKTGNASKLREINEKLTQADKALAVSQSKHLDVLYRAGYTMRLIAGVLALSVGAVIAALFSLKNMSGTAAKVLAIYLIAAMLGMAALGLGSRVM